MECDTGHSSCVCRKNKSDSENKICCMSLHMRNNHTTKALDTPNPFHWHLCCVLWLGTWWSLESQTSLPSVGHCCQLHTKTDQTNSAWQSCTSTHACTHTHTLVAPLAQDHTLSTQQDVNISAEGYPHLWVCKTKRPERWVMAYSWLHHHHHNSMHLGV